MLREDTFFNDSLTGFHLTYSAIIEKINGNKTIVKHLYNCSLEDYYLNLLKAIIGNVEIDLLDLDYSGVEVERLVGDSLDTSESEIQYEIKSVEELIHKVEESKARLGIYTSGTTGKPKRIVHPVNRFISSARTGEKYKNDIWGFAFNPTHMAGLQVFFQSFLNRNPMVNIFSYQRKEIERQINDWSISHISASPSFYRSLLTDNFVCASVNRLTLGGEKSTKNFIEKLENIFPNAKVNNIYASTEIGAGLVADGELFTIPTSKSNLIKIEDDLLLFHRSIVAEFDFKGDWYSTGDKVEVVSHDPLKFKFVSREGTSINVGGYNVEPSEVEEMILQLDGVNDVSVYGKKNKMIGNLLMANIVLSAEADLKEIEIISFLREGLQSHKIPRIIKFVDAIELGRTGKK